MCMYALVVCLRQPRLVWRETDCTLETSVAVRCLLNGKIPASVKKHSSVE